MKDIYLARVKGGNLCFSKNHGLEGEFVIPLDKFDFNGVVSADRIGRTLTEEDALMEAVNRGSDVVVRTFYPNGGRFAVANAYSCFKCDESVLERLRRESRAFPFDRCIENDADRLVY